MSEASSFDHFNFDPSILKAIIETGYTKPTPIQAKAIPIILTGRDIIASAPTGTGKTAAFVLPALNRMMNKSTKKATVLVLTPTRELAQQVTASAAKYGKYMRFKAVSIVGGMPYPVQFRELSRPLDMLIATPGRLMDIMERQNSVDLSAIEMIILDEADRMLDMGFIDDMRHIFAHLKKVAPEKKRQVLLFSATLDDRIGKLAKNLLQDPAIVEVAHQKATHTQIEQRLYMANDMAHKDQLLTHILDNEAIYQAIIFSATKRHAEDFARKLTAAGHTAAALHGDMKQSQRNRTLDLLRRGKIQLLVATDVAARGIDVQGISHVINYGLPRMGEDYVHRIGRTGRAGKTGIAITLAMHDEVAFVRRIEKYTGSALEQFTIPGLEPRIVVRQHAAPRRPYNRSNGGYRGGYQGNNNNSGGYRGRNSEAAPASRTSKPYGSADGNRGGYRGKSHYAGSGYQGKSSYAGRNKNETGNRSYRDDR